MSAKTQPPYEPGGASSGASHSPSYAHYFAIWGWLVALLVGGTFVSLLPLSRTNVIFGVLLIALIKAILVALFYMHLKYEKLAPLWVVVLFPLFLITMAASLIFIGKIIGY